MAKARLGAVRIDDYKYRFIDQPRGWLGEKTHVDVPYLINLRLDPFERTGWPDNGTKEGAQQYFDWFKFEFWRFVFVQQVVGKAIQTFLDFPPMQRGASFNLDAVKAEMAKGWPRPRRRPRAPASNTSSEIICAARACPHGEPRGVLLSGVTNVSLRAPSCDHVAGAHAESL